MDLSQFTELLTEALWSAGEEQGVALTTREKPDGTIVVTVGDDGAEYEVKIVRSR